MTPHTNAGGPVDLTQTIASKMLQVVDLWNDPARRLLWRTRSAAVAPPLDAGLPIPGQPSPMGYWIGPAATTTVPRGPVITFVDPGDNPGPAPDSFGHTFDGACVRPVQTVRVKSANVGDGDITLTIGPGGARITTSPGAWKTTGEAVLLAACQYWRFATVDAEIARLTEQANADLDHSNMPGIATLKAHARVVASARAVRALLLDLPHFQGPLTDPFPYCSSERSAQTYENLAKKLRLEEWCELIDERAEAIEDAYEALTEKLFEYKNFAWEAVLETIIIVILVAELVVMGIELILMR